MPLSHRKSKKVKLISITLLSKICVLKVNQKNNFRCPVLKITDVLWHGPVRQPDCKQYSKYHHVIFIECVLGQDNVSHTRF